MNKLNFKREFKDWMMGLQFLLCALGAVVLVPLLTGLNPSSAILSAGLATLVFHLCTKKQVPIFLGSSFAFISPIVSVMASHGYAYVQGSVIVVGIVYMLISLLVYKVGIDKILKFIPNHISGVMIVLIGLILMPSAITNIQTNLAIATLTLLVIILTNIFTKGIIKQFSVLIGLIFGYLLSLWLGVVDLNIITSFDAVVLPQLSVPKFALDALLVIVPVSIATLTEHLADMSVCGTIVDKDFRREPGLHKTILGDGLGTVIGGLVSGVPNTSYSECTSLLEITKIRNPRILRIAGVLAIILSFVGVFTGLLQSIPSSVIGAMSLYLYAMISWVGVKNIKKEKDSKGKLTLSNIFVMIIMFIVGLSDVIGLNIVLQIGGITLSGLSLAILVGIVLNAIITSIEKRVTSK